MLSAADQGRLREEFAAMTRPVRLLLFTQTFGCETCQQARQVVDELPPLSDRVTVEEVNFVLEPDRARQYGIDRVPALALTYLEPAGAEGKAPPAVRDSRIRFVGVPAGYAFISLVQAVLLVGGRPPRLTGASRERLGALARPITMQVFTTPT